MYSGRDGIAALPYFDEFDLSTIDVLLISQYVPLLFLAVGVLKLSFYTTGFIPIVSSGKMSQMNENRECAGPGCLLSIQVPAKSCTSLDEPQYNDVQTSSI
jgi:hypothetical protein